MQKSFSILQKGTGFCDFIWRTARQKIEKLLSSMTSSIYQSPSTYQSNNNPNEHNTFHHRNFTRYHRGRTAYPWPSSQELRLQSLQAGWSSL